MQNLKKDIESNKVVEDKKATYKWYMKYKEGLEAI